MVGDTRNAPKTGDDPIFGRWDDWIAATGFDSDLLAPVRAPGKVVGPLSRNAARAFGWPETVQIVAGMTDGCASLLVTGATKPGQGVSALGTTMALKILSDRPIFAPEFGVYSHRHLGMWLAGGA